MHDCSDTVPLTITNPATGCNPDALSDGLRGADARPAAGGYGILLNDPASTDVDVHKLLTRSAGVVLPRISAVPHICKHRRTRWRAHKTLDILICAWTQIDTHAHPQHILSCLPSTACWMGEKCPSEPPRHCATHKMLLLATVLVSASPSRSHVLKFECY